MLQQIPPNPPFSKGGTGSYPPLAKGGRGDFHSNPLHHGTIHFAPTVLRHSPGGCPYRLGPWGPAERGMPIIFKGGRPPTVSPAQAGVQEKETGSRPTPGRRFGLCGRI